MKEVKSKGKFKNKKEEKAVETSLDHTVHYVGKYVSLVEDTFGMLFDYQNNPIFVKRFTWSNHNKISVSVITYGARVISMKLPDRGTNVEEIMLGFDDLAGYLFYDEYSFGATVGRTTSCLYKSTYVVDGKQYWLKPNVGEGEHHEKGGFRGLDKVNWVPYVNGNVLQLSYMSPDGDEGYPGDLHIRMTFELTTGAEFRMSITANTTKITPVDISNIIYFNLAGHNSGQEELRKHELLINANCHTPMDENNQFPTGKILNVVHTKFNFQVPLLLGKAMGEGPEAEYEQNFCVNRGVHQGDAFVARVTHPFKGRVLEIYSNQHGVHFSNGSTFPDGHQNIPAELLTLKPSMTSQEIREHESLFIVIAKIAQFFREKMQMPPEDYHNFIRNLMNKLLADDSEEVGIVASENSFTSELDLIDALSMTGKGHHAPFPEFDLMMILKPLEVQFLLAIRALLPYVTEDIPFDVVKEAIDDILERQRQVGDAEDSNTGEGDESSSFIDKIILNQLRMRAQSQKQIEDEEEEEEEEEMPEKGDKSVFQKLQDAKHEREMKQFKSGVPIPPHYKKERIVGRGGVVYKRYSGMCLRTQCYPNALLEEKFPTPILRPNETYTHTITYKFWVLAGNPAKWQKRLQLNNPCEEVSTKLF